jgi:hypothetical protein
MSKLFVITLISTLLFSACYIESPQERATSPGNKMPSGEAGLTQVRDSCELTLDRGCIEGQITPSPRLFVNGQEFFDAEDLANRFAELITVADQSTSKMLQENEYELEFLNPFSNKSFTDKFEVYLKGDYAAVASLRQSGAFFFNRLPQGSYEVRAQRPIQFKLKKALVTDPGEVNEDGDAEDVVESVERLYCATLYQDIAVDVYPAERSERQLFDQFSLYLTEAKCPNYRIDQIIKF